MIEQSMSRFLTLFLSMILAGSAACADALRTDFSEEERTHIRDRQYGLIALPLMRAAAADEEGPSRPLLNFEGMERHEMPAGFEKRLRLILQDGPRDGLDDELRDLRLFAEADHVRLAICGEVNRRNLYGAYTGFEPFLVIALNPDAADDAGEVVVLSEPWISDACDKMQAATFELHG
jgi:hypothetical protein